MVEQPSGTVTLVFTDIEGSTRLLRELGREAYREALTEHRRIVREACGRHAGYEVDCEGDTFFYAFQSAVEAVSAVEEAIRELEAGPIRIRVGVHTGEPGLDPPKYIGLDVHLAARVMAAAHGGQVLLTPASHELVEAELKPLGEHRLRDIPDPVHLYQLGELAFPPLRSLYRTNLPMPVTPFLGREQALAEVLDLLARDDVRLLTLTGPGGIGKTRLGLQAAAETSELFPDGITWVPLAPLRDPSLVLPSVAHALGVKQESGCELAETLTALLAGKQALLLLDNAEHLLPQFIRELAPLRAIGGLRLLVTSRERLRLQGEHVYAVRSLSDPDGVALFLARAPALDPTFAAAAVAELCARLDNLPLAVELAAGRASVLSPAQILERLTPRLDLLTGGPRDADPRQQALRATIEWSHDLLSGPERQLFARLSVFARDWTLEAAEQVADAGLDTLQSLLEKSLIHRSGERYGMLQTVREYAQERLVQSGAEAAIRRAHAAHFVQVAEAAANHLVGPEQRRALNTLDADVDNLRDALTWSHARKPVWALRLAASLGRYWAIRGFYREARHWLDVVVAFAELEPSAGARALLAAGNIARYEGDRKASREFFEQGLLRARLVGPPEYVAKFLTVLGQLEYLAGNADGARARLREALAVRPPDDIDLEAVASVSLALVSVDAGEYDAAAVLLASSAAAFEAIGDQARLAVVMSNLAYVQDERGELGEAISALCDGLRLAADFDDASAASLALVVAASTVGARAPLQAARWLGFAEATYERLGREWEPLDRCARRRALETIARALDETELATARDAGAQLLLVDAVADARSVLEAEPTATIPDV